MEDASSPADGAAYGAGYYWLPLDTTGLSRLPVMPAGAVVAGFEGDLPIYVARIQSQEQKYKGTWELGKLSSSSIFHYGLHGKEIWKDQGEVLVAKDASTYPVWISGAYGERVPNVMMSLGPGGYQSVGRAYDPETKQWICGKVLHWDNGRMLCYPINGKEIHTRQYWLLSTALVWKVPAAVPEDAVRAGDQTPQLGASAGVIYPSARPHGLPAHAVLAQVSPAVGCRWVPSGDGEFVRHSVAGEGGHALARVRVDGTAGPVWSMAPLHSGAGAVLAGNTHKDYEVLVAGPAGAGYKLAMHLQLDKGGDLKASRAGAARRPCWTRRWRWARAPGSQSSSC